VAKNFPALSTVTRLPELIFSAPTAVPPTHIELMLAVPLVEKLVPVRVTV